MIPTGRFNLALVIILSFAVFGELWDRNSNCQAGDWPQILGPNRDGQAIDESPLKVDWKESTPKELWTMPVSSGYAGAAIVSGTVFLADRSASQERLTAVELQSGKKTWQATWPASYRSSMDPDSGPRAVPVISGGKAVCYGAAGDLVCVDTTNGKVIWNLPLRKQYSAEDGYFGAGCSPIVIGDMVIVNIGGKKAGIVGVSLSKGKVSWQATTYDASYASPIAIDISGKPAALVVTRLKTVLLDVQTGKVLSEMDFGARGPTVNAATPLALGNQQYFLTASYNIGAKLVELNGGELKVNFANKELLASQYNSPVKIGSVVIGANGREDGGDVSLRMLDLGSQKVIAEQPLPGTTHLIAIGEQLLMLSIDGTLQLAKVTNDKFEVTGHLAVPQASPGVFRALPAFSEHILIARSSQAGQGGTITAIMLP